MKKGDIIALFGFFVWVILATTILFTVIIGTISPFLFFIFVVYTFTFFLCLPFVQALCGLEKQPEVSK